MESLSDVLSAVRFMTSPMSLTASMFIPIFVVATSTEPQTLSVLPKASGMESISIRSDRVMPFATSAEYPPMKLIPIFFAALSRVCAMVMKSSGVLQAEDPTMLIGVTETLLLTMGIPYSRLMSSATGIRSRAVLTILSYIFSLRESRSGSQHSMRLMPMVTVLTSRFSLSIILLVSRTSSRSIMRIRIRLCASC